MWLAKLKLRHDCIIGNRCKKFSVKSVGYPQDSYTEGGNVYFLHFEKLIGNNTDGFYLDLKKDKNIRDLERNGNLIFFSYKVKDKRKMPSNIHLKKVMFSKPVIVDEEGFETWEVVTWDRGILNKFISQTEKNAYGLKDFKVEKIVQTNMKEVYFQKVMPELSKEQGRALSMAIDLGYYGYPREVELKDLAKRLGISLSTYREHLRRAEKKVMPLLV